MDATVLKWGNSRGLRLPAEAIRELGVEDGERAEVRVDVAHRAITLVFPDRGRPYSRSGRLTMEQFADGWDGPKVGIEWGGHDVGAEVVE